MLVDISGNVKTGHLDIWLMEGQQSSARTALWPSRPERLICRRRRAYIPPPVHFTEDPFGQNLNSVDITSGFKEVSLPFCQNPQVQYLLVEGTALGEYASQALIGRDAAQPKGCSAPFVPCVTNETIDPLTTGVIYLSGFRQWKYSQILRQDSRLQALGQILRIFRL